MIVQSTCLKCQKEHTGFKNRCDKCGGDLIQACTCKECNADVLQRFLPGHSQETGKLLDLCRALHAEERAILSIAKNGLSMPENAVMYSTTYPCNLCANKIVSTGIRKLVYSEPYDMPEAKKLFSAYGIEPRRFEGVKSTAYFRLYS